MSVLIVQPDSSAADSLLQQLNRYGYDASTVGTGTPALNKYQEAELIVLDLELPDLDGLEVCRTILWGSIIGSRLGGLAIWDHR